VDPVPDPLNFFLVVPGIELGPEANGITFRWKSRACGSNFSRHAVTQLTLFQFQGTMTSKQFVQAIVMPSLAWAKADYPRLRKSKADFWSSLRFQYTRAFELLICNFCPYALNFNILIMLYSLTYRPPLWSSGRSSWLQIQGSRVRFPGTTKKSSGSGTGSTQPREYN
jgi:hypothetical protein